MTCEVFYGTLTYGTEVLTGLSLRDGCAYGASLLTGLLITGRSRLRHELSSGTLNFGTEAEDHANGGNPTKAPKWSIMQ